MLLAACSSAEQTPGADSAGVMTIGSSDPADSVGAPAVFILAPAEGDSITLPYTLRFGATGVEVVPANGLREEGRGHHHLVIDGDAPASDAVALPAAPTVIHVGTGATELVLDSLAPGPHRLISIFASGDHVPWTTVRRDTVNFVVR